MIGTEIGERKPVSLATVKAILKSREKEGELHYEQKLALEHASKFGKLEEKDVNGLVAELLKLEIPRFKERHAIKIADFLPEDAEVIKTIFAKESLTLKKEQMQQILDVVAKYR